MCLGLSTKINTFVLTVFVILANYILQLIIFDSFQIYRQECPRSLSAKGDLSQV